MDRNRRSSAHTLCLFTVLAKRPQAWQYGYQLSQLTALKSGTLYPILMRLCERGLLESKWQPSPQRGRPPRHMYRFTASGAAFARSELQRESAEPTLGQLAGRYA
jgi:PadR family transcriptional regulator, regulatory protein PadR